MSEAAPGPPADGGPRVLRFVHRRFWRIWILFAALYSALALVGQNGLRGGALWPDNNQHLLLARAWLGEDIELPETAPGGGRRIEVEPRLDVTPYFHHRVVGDPRDETMLSNLTLVIPDGEGGYRPAQPLIAAEPENDDLLSRVVCHVGFPPGPAFLLFPLRLLFGGALATQWLSALLGGLAVALVDRLFGSWPGIPERLRSRMVVLAGIGTPWIWLAPPGGTNYFAQVVATTGLTATLVGLSERRWTLAGIALAIALTSRPSMVGAAPLVLWLWWTGGAGRRLSSMLRLAAAPAFAGAASLVLNHLRFGHALDFGYRAMFTPPEVLGRMLEHGQLSFVFFFENVRWVVLAPPILVRGAEGAPAFPWLVSDPHGMGLFFVSPALLAIFATVNREHLGTGTNRVLWISLVLTCLPGLLYFNSGWVQWGGRFLIDAWPLFLVLAALGSARMPRRLVTALVALSCLGNLWAVALTDSGIWPSCCPP